MQNRRVVALLVIAVILASFLTYALASSPSTTMTFSSGIYPGAPSYTVYSVSGTYYAKDQNGVIDYYGTDAATVINDAIADGGCVCLASGSYDISSSILVEEDGTKIIGDQKGSVILSWSGSVGGSVITTTTTPYLYDLTIENLELDLNDEANGIYLYSALRFTIRDVTIAGGTSSNTYSGIVIDATYGNAGWGKIDNIFMDYVAYGLNVFGTDANHVVTDFEIGAIYGTNIKYYGLRFAQWCDTIDCEYGFFTSGGDNACGMICNDGASPNNDNGVYDIHCNRFIYDNWVYSSSYCIKLNNCKQIVIDSLYKGNSTEVFGAAISGYAESFYIVQQGQADGDNGINIYYRNMTMTEVPP